MYVSIECEKSDVDYHVIKDTNIKEHECNLVRKETEVK